MRVNGKTGTNKTTFPLNMAVNDINDGESLGFINPQGDANSSRSKSI